MAKSIRVPTLQHMARIWSPDPDRISRQLLENAYKPPPFSCDCLNVAARDIVMLGLAYEQVVEFVRRSEPRKPFQGFLLEAVPLLYGYLTGLNIKTFQYCARRHYHIAPDIKIPFCPPFIYGVGGQQYVPWFSFWRTNPIGQKPLSMFVTIVEEMFLNDADLEDARFHIIDLSRPKGHNERELSVIDTRNIPRLDEGEKRAMLEVFADGYRRAQESFAQSRATAEVRGDTRPDPRQSDLFNPEE
jgi:hypothetical protein